MQPYDLFMLVVLVGATVFGAMKGMAWQAASLSSIVLSYFVALNFSGPLAPMFHQQAPWNRFLAMAVLYGLTSLSVWLVFRIVAGAIDRIKLKDFDRQMGALFGALKGALLCLAITLFAVTLSANARSAVLKSRSGVYISQVLNKAEHVIPPELHDVLDPYLNRLERGLDPNQPNPGSASAANPPTGSLREAVGQQVRDTVGQAVENTWRQFGEETANRFSEPAGRAPSTGFERDGFGQPYRTSAGYQAPSQIQPPAAVSRNGWGQPTAPSRFDDEDARDAAADRPISRR
jgi:membrane protein required for colicin V production